MYFYWLIPQNCRSQWPRGLRRRSTAARLLRSWVRIPLEAWMFVCCESLCCQVEVSATDWSLVQGSPTDCGASLCVIKKPRTRGGYSPLEGCKIQTHSGLCSASRKKNHCEYRKGLIYYCICIEIQLCFLTDIPWSLIYCSNFVKQVCNVSFFICIFLVSSHESECIQENDKAEIYSFAVSDGHKAEGFVRPSRPSAKKKT
jgi:hypothetical protein